MTSTHSLVWTLGASTPWKVGSNSVYMFQYCVLFRFNSTSAFLFHSMAIQQLSIRVLQYCVQREKIFRISPHLQLYACHMYVYIYICILYVYMALYGIMCLYRYTYTIYIYMHEMRTRLSIWGKCHHQTAGFPYQSWRLVKPLQSSRPLLTDTSDGPTWKTRFMSLHFEDIRVVLRTGSIFILWVPNTKLLETPEKPGNFFPAKKHTHFPWPLTVKAKHRPLPGLLKHMANMNWWQGHGMEDIHISPEWNI